MLDVKQEELVQEFALFPDWTQKYEYIIDKGKKLQPYPEEFKTDSYLIKECQSQLWLYPTLNDNQLHFYAQSDALITKGLAALVLDIVNGRTPEEIVSLEIYLFEQTELHKFLSMQRSNGLNSLISKVKAYAKDCSSNVLLDSIVDREHEVIEVLKTVFDPEIPVNIYDLGLIYKVTVSSDQNVHILMTLTAPGCPAVDIIMNEIETKVNNLNWIKDVEIEITFTPPWDKAMMSDEAKLELGFL